MNGYRVVLLGGIVAVVGLAIAGVVFSESPGLIIGLASPTVVALMGLLRAEQTKQQIEEHRKAVEDEDK